MMRLTKKNGQSTLEYAVVIAVVIAALVLMGWGWFKGGYQKKLMSATDDISGGGQFDNKYTVISTSQTRNSTSFDQMTGTTMGAKFFSSSNETAGMSTTANTDDLATRRP